MDVFARAGESSYSIIGEVKNRDTKKFSKKETADFLNKIQKLESMEKLCKSVGFVFSLTGFTAGAIELFKKHGIAWTRDKRWLD